LLCLCLEYLLQEREYFSIMGNIWSAERGRLLVSTVKHLLNVKINSELSCCEFYDVIKTSKPFLKKSCLVKSTTESTNR
jgi:hypothetical protein